MKCERFVGIPQRLNQSGTVRKRLPVQMARNKRDHDRSAFRAEDEIDQLFGGANPNPERIGCPGGDVLKAAARKGLPVEHEVYDHLTECSECYREYRQFQQRSNRRPAWINITTAVAAALVVAIVGGSYALRWFRMAQSSAVAQTLVLDYRDESPSRSEAGNRSRKTNKLPRRTVAATILMPTGSEPGRYELKLIDRGGRARLYRAAQGAIENLALRIRVDLDLRKIPSGSYWLELRRAGEDWDPHPVSIE
jgi:hypothetical protein